MADIASQGLAWLIEPISFEEFLHDYFEQKCLHVCRGSTLKYRELARLEDIDSILWQQEHNLRTFVSIFQKDIELHPDRIIDGSTYRQWIADKYESGATIVLRNLHKYKHSLATMHRLIAEQIKGAVTVNAYVTPPHSIGFLAHFDAHDVFILQIHGEKQWMTYGLNGAPLPTRRSTERIDPIKLGKPAHDLVLQTGDTLYIPRGHIHYAKTNELNSMHLTIGIKPCLWSDTLKSIIDIASEADVALRKSVVASSEQQNHHILINLVLSTMKNQYGLKDAMERSMRIIESRLIGQLSPLSDPNHSRFDMKVELQPDTLLVRNPGAICSVDASCDTVKITFPGLGNVENPAAIVAPIVTESAIRYILSQTAPFSVRDLPGSLSSNSKCILCAKLIKAGLLHNVKKEY